MTLTAHNGARFYKNGQECGKKVVVSDSVKGITWGKDETVLSDSGFKIEEGISNGYQFKMDVTPSVTANATILDVSIKSNTLMGYLSDGTPRQSQLEPLTTRIMIGNKNNRFVIGGIEKLDVVRGQGGIPILKDIRCSAGRSRRKASPPRNRNWSWWRNAKVSVRTARCRKISIPIFRSSAMRSKAPETIIPTAMGNGASIPGRNLI